MFTIFEARSMDTGELVSGLSITATFYDVNGSQTVLTAPVDLGGGRYAINLEESGTVVLDTSTENIFLPILRFQYSVEQDVDSIQSSVAAMQEDLEGITSVPTAEDNASAVWSATTRTLTSDAAPSAETVASAVWAYVTGSGSSAETELTSTATSTELSAVAAGRTLADLATPSDVELTTTTETVEVVSQVVDLTELKTYGDTNWSTATGFATPTNLDSAVSSITAHGDTNWSTATGFATPEDVHLTTTTETVEVTTQTVDLTELKTYGDTNWSTATGFSTPTDVSNAVSTLTSHGDTHWSTAAGFATAESLSTLSAGRTLADLATPEDVQLTTTTQTVDLTELKTYGDANWKTATGFVTSVPSTSDIATSVWSYGTSSNDRTVKAEGVKVEGVTVDFTELEAYGDTHWSTAAGFATSTELSTIAAGRTLADLATPDDVHLTTTTETVDLTDLKAYGDTNWSTAVGFSTPSDVSGAVSSITTHGDTNWKTATGFATPDDVHLTTTTETVDLTELKSYGDTHWSTATGFVTSVPTTLEIATSVWSYGDNSNSRTVKAEGVQVEGVTVDFTELEAYGDLHWATATGFATPDDVQLTTTTETVDLTELKTYGDSNWRTATGFATSTALSSMAAGRTLADLATPNDLQITTETVEVTTQTVDLTELKTYGDAHWSTATGFVTSVPSTSDIATSVWSYGDSSNSRTVKAEGVQVEGVTVDFTELEAYGDSHWATATGFATPADVQLTTTTETVEVVSQTVDLTELKTYGDTNWSTATGFATSTELSTIAAGRTLADLATPDDVQLTTTTQTVDLTELKTYGDANWSTATGFSTASDVTNAASSVMSHGDTYWTTATGFATPSDVKLTTTTETVDLTELKTYGDTNWKTATGFVTSVPSTADIATSVWSYGDNSNSRTVKAEGVQVEGVTVDFTELEAYGDLHWSTATGFATPTNLDSAVSAITTYGDANWKTATGFATPDDVQLTTTTETVEVISQVVDLTELKTYGDTNWKTAAGFATPANLDSAVSSITTYGDTNWKTATGFATPEDVKLTTTTETVDLTELKTYGDTNWSTATGFATPSNVTAAVSSITSHGDTHWSTATGFATPEDVTLTTTTQTVDLTELKTYGDSNWKTATGFVTSVPSTADIATSVWSYGTSSNDRTVKAEGVQVEGVTVDFTELKTYGDAHWRTATGFVTSVPTTSEIAAAIWGYDDKVVPLTDADLANVARSVLTYDLTNLDSNSVRYSADNALRLMMLASNTNNHSAAGDTYSALKTNGMVKAQFNVITNKRGEREKIS